LIANREKLFNSEENLTATAAETTRKRAYSSKEIKSPVAAISMERVRRKRRGRRSRCPKRKRSRRKRVAAVYLVKYLG
jgi:hypothetical protein